LAKQKAGSPEFSARAKVLKELIEHHIEEEEGELFDKAEEVLGEERLEQIGDKMQELMENPPANLPEPKLLGGTRKAA
jgi:hemerythrin-like domain-containing protein